MSRSRRQRLRARLSIVMIVALLFSQFAMAAHSVCAVADLSHATTAAAAVVQPDCHQTAPPDESAVCSAHCSQGDQSSDVGRVPLVPALAVASAAEFAVIVMAPVQRSSYAELPPPVSWHRPTAHPASLLLI